MNKLIMWKCFKVLDIFQFFLEFPFWRLGVVRDRYRLFILRVVLSRLGSFKNNTGKYHGGRLQTTNNHLWKKQHPNVKMG